jgi:hypothetical protein
MRSSLILMLLALAAAPALAQDEPDGIGALLNRPPPAPKSAEAANPLPPAGPPLAMPPQAPATAPGQPPAAQVDQTGVSPDGPPSETDLAFENRIRQSVAAAQGLQGPLDGRWTLYDRAGHPLYVFMFVDPAGGRGALEGAWRDPRRARGGDDLGVVDRLEHVGLSLTLDFTPRAGVGATAVRLENQASGAWDGEMTEAGSVQKVSLRRN